MIVLIRRTNYPILELGEGTHIYSFRGTINITEEQRLQISKTWHLGPKPGGTFWNVYPDKWIDRPEAIFIVVNINQKILDNNEIYYRPFFIGEEIPRTTKYWARMNSTNLTLVPNVKYEFYLVPKFSNQESEVIYL